MAAIDDEDIDDDSAPIYENEKLDILIRKMRLCESATFYVDTISNGDIMLISDELRTNRMWNFLQIIGENLIKEDGVKYLFEALSANTSVKALHLCGNSLGNRSVKLFMNSLASNTTIEDLNLTDNQITDIGAQAISEMLRTNTALTILILHGNPLSDIGITLIAQVLQHNRTLTTLKIGRTGVTDMGAEDLALMIQLNTTLKKLSLDNNRISDIGMQALCMALKQNQALEYIDIRQNRISDKSIDDIVSLLQTNQTLNVLNLVRNRFSDQGKNTLRQAEGYVVWFDLTDMRSNIIDGMAEAVENSYIVLLCINHAYFESRYCKSEAQYALEKRIKIIPCFMEEPFELEGWLGIIHGANYRIDFSLSEEFDESFKLLIREIKHTEAQLSINPRSTSPGVSISSPTSRRPVPTPITVPSNTYLTLHARLDAIIRDYKDSIENKPRHVSKGQRKELEKLISQLRQQLIHDASLILPNSRTYNNDHELLQHLNRSLDLHQLLIDSLIPPSPIQRTRGSELNINTDRIMKLVLTVLALWGAKVLYQRG
ncbi:unnamed protein product [Adineta steineri]|uniref:TIR domain-containing protein n=1 Tax=Adineta steineri TaxID=433720 RepID=A0A819E180_9BILA|nr:unnamed protein product [Adineta steineri]